MKIRAAELVFPDKKKYKIEYSQDFVDIVKKLLNKDRTQRLGTEGGAAEILSHPWFASLNLEDIKSGAMEPPLKMDCSEENGYRFFNSKQPQDLAETVLPQEKLDIIEKGSHHFKNFDSIKNI